MDSHAFIFIFLPLIVMLFKFFDERWSLAGKTGVLFFASFLFYALGENSNFFLLAFSVLVNFLGGNLIASSKKRKKQNILLAMLIVLNLLILIYYKYLNFLLSLFDADLFKEHIQSPLPVGISFFTFTQIAYLVDVHRSQSHETNFFRYGLFVSYFPHLVAGPLLSAQRILPQLRNSKLFSWKWDDIAIGLTIFIFGLFKKVFIADGIQEKFLLSDLNSVIWKLKNGFDINAIEAWVDTLAYTLRIYFDFSGYSDMAIGLSLLFGIRIPINFASPYKAASIIDFWRRWHISLSNFLRDYVYISLGGSRKGEFRRYLNITLTMVLGGVWHGAGWTFIVWGALHAFFLCINHAWRGLLKNKPVKLSGAVIKITNTLSWLLTFGFFLKRLILNHLGLYFAQCLISPR
jgi:alginate O-acetyltransferase complex protein AlgI